MNLRTCVIYIDSDALTRTAKLWVPVEYGLAGSEIELWWSEGNEIADYIKAWPYGWTPGKTLLMSWMQGFEDEVQLLIPPPLVAPSGALGLSAVCKEHTKDLPDTKAINYDDWQENIDGQRGEQPPDED